MLNALRAQAAARRGKAGEDAAARYLCGQGFRILERNWRQGSFELDLVCEDGETLVFVEVRTRARAGMVSSAESMTPAKQRSLLKAARLYLAAHQSWERPCRFDVICVSADHELQLEHIRHAFE